MIVRALLVALAGCFALPAFAVTPTALASGSSTANSASLALTTTADAPVGTVINCYAANLSAGNNINSATDSAGTPNTYAALNMVQNTGIRGRFFKTTVTSDLAPGQTITFTFATVSTSVKAAACVVVTAGTEDANPTGTLNTSTTPSISTTGTLPSSNEIIFGAVVVATGAADTFTEDSTYTSLTPVLSTGAMRWAYKIVNTNAQPTYAPTLGTSRVWGASMSSFRITPTACYLSLLGVGAC